MGIWMWILVGLVIYLVLGGILAGIALRTHADEDVAFLMGALWPIMAVLFLYLCVAFCVKEFEFKNPLKVKNKG